MLAGAVMLWTTPCVRDAESLAKVSRGAGSLAAGQERVPPLAVQAAQWPTPGARDYRSPNAKPYADRGGATKGEQLPNFLAHCCAGPPDPASVSTSGRRRDSWQTPTVTDGEGRPYTYSNGDRNKPFLTLMGQAQPEGTDHRRPSGQLNPAWVTQLQGLPDGWLDLPSETLERLYASSRSRGGKD